MQQGFVFSVTTAVLAVVALVVIPILLRTLQAAKARDFKNLRLVTIYYSGFTNSLMVPGRYLETTLRAIYISEIDPETAHPLVDGNFATRICVSYPKETPLSWGLSVQEDAGDVEVLLWGPEAEVSFKDNKVAA